MTVKEQKKLLRTQIKKLKANIDSKYRNRCSLSVFSKLESEREFISAKNILAFWSMDDEIDTKAFIQKWASSKNIYLPVIKGDTLVLKKFVSLNNMKAEPRFGILEPQGYDLENWNEIQYSLIPGVAFDTNMNRLGRGKGFYDRVLSRINAIKVGICFDFQYVDYVPVEENDISMDMVITC